MKDEMLKGCVVICNAEIKSPRYEPLNPAAARTYLRAIGLLDVDSTVPDDEDLMDAADKAADDMIDGCSLILNLFLRAAAHKQYSTMYRLYVEQMNVLGKRVPISVRAIAGLNDGAVWKTFADLIADSIECILDDESEDDDHNKSGLEEEEDWVMGLTD